MKTWMTVAWIALAFSAQASLSGLTASVDSLSANFTGSYQWRETDDTQTVTFVIEKKSESGGVIHFSGHDTYTLGNVLRNTMIITGEINRKDRTITFTESNPSNPGTADVDGKFKGTVSRDLRTITAVWTGNDGRLGDLSLDAVTPDHPLKRVPATPAQKKPPVSGH